MHDLQILREVKVFGVRNLKKLDWVRFLLFLTGQKGRDA